MLAAVLLSALLNESPPVTDPYVIFDRARAFWSSQQYPSVVDYTVHVVATDANARRQERHYHEYWRADLNSMVVQPPVSDEQLADPYTPSGGFTFGLLGSKMGDIGGPGTGVKGDLFDVPALAPNYSFGVAPYAATAVRGLSSAQIVAEIRREYHDPAPKKIAELEQRYGLKTIAAVVSVRRDYTITLQRVESVDDHQDYHLSMQPLADPQRYRLRDIWIDTHTYATDKLRVGANFKDKATESIPWLIRLRQMSGATYIRSETAEEPIDGFRGRMYDAFAISFEGVSTGRMPFWMGGSQGGGSLSEP